MNINIPKNVKFIIDTYYNNNYEAFMVGGCVRDSLLGLKPKDFDITTSALPEITENLFTKTIPTGIKHGTVTVVIDKENFEVTTYRTEENYIDNRRPEKVEFVKDLKEDLSRRDFTINAFAYNDKEGLIDYFNGMDDLKNKVIRAVGDPNKRFNEDALRMLRAIRFSAQLGFSIESKTYDAIKDNVQLIKNISNERIRDELCKILLSDNPCEGIETLRETNMLSIILPEINDLVEYTPLCNNHNRNVFTHTLKVLNNTYANLNLRLAALFHDIGKINTITALPSEEGAKMVMDVLKRLKFDNLTIESISALIKHHLVLNVSYMPTDGEIKRLINNVGKENIFILFDLQRADINALWDPVPFLKKVDFMESRTKFILDNNEPLTLKDLAIDGKTLITELKILPGKEVGIILHKLLEDVLDNKDLNNKNQLINLAKKYKELMA